MHDIWCKNAPTFVYLVQTCTKSCAVGNLEFSNCTIFGVCTFPAFTPFPAFMTFPAFTTFGAKKKPKVVYFLQNCTKSGVFGILKFPNCVTFGNCNTIGNHTTIGNCTTCGIVQCVVIAPHLVQKCTKTGAFGAKMHQK
jgi:branched-subunit amino acid transport protein AzlD